MVALVFVAFAFLLNRYINPEKIEKQLVALVSEQMNADLTLDTLDIKLFPYAIVTINDVILKQRTNQAELRLSSIELRLNKIIDLLANKQLTVEHLKADTITYNASPTKLQINGTNIYVTTNLLPLYNKFVADNYTLGNVADYINMIQLDGNLNTDKITFNTYNIDSVDTKFSLADQLLTFDIENITLYSGSIKGIITSLDALKPESALAFDITAENIKTSDLVQHEFITKYTSLNASATLKGMLKNRILPPLEAFEAAGTFKLFDGHIKGIDINEMVKNNPKALINIGKTDLLKTDILEAHADYSISNGIVINNKIYADTGLVELSAQGKTDLNKRDINYRITPKLDVIPGAENKSIPLIPLNVVGTFDKIRFIPDISSVIENRVVGTINDIMKDPKNAKNIIKGLKNDLQGNRDSLIDGLKQIGTPKSDANDNNKAEPEEVINNLLKIVP